MSEAAREKLPASTILTKYRSCRKCMPAHPDLGPTGVYANLQTKAPAALPQIEPIEVHDLVPGRHEATDKLRLRIRAPIDLGQRPQLRVGTEYEIGARRSPLDRPALAVAPLI